MLLRELGATVYIRVQAKFKTSVSVRRYLGLGSYSGIKHTGTAGTLMGFNIRKTSNNCSAPESFTLYQLSHVFLGVPSDIIWNIKKKLC